MVDENVPALAPTRSDDQILPFVAWVPIGKSNYVLDLQKKAFTASASVPTIYIQQFWNTLTYEAKTKAYSFHLDETRFVLDANLLREALEITPIDQAHQFVSPPSGDAIMDFVNELGYTENLYKPFRLFLLIRPIWAVPLRRTGKTRLTSASPFHLAEEDLRLGNLKFVPKGEEDEVFGMPIPNELISNNIRNALYYNAYLEMVAKHDRKITAEKEGKKKPATVMQPKPKPAKEKSSKPAPAPKPKVTKEKPSKLSPAKHPKREEATQLLPVIKGKGKAIATDEQAAQSLLALHTPKKRNTTYQFIFQRRTPATEEASTGPSTQPQDDTSANIVRDSPSHADAETCVDTDKTNSRDHGKTSESRPPPEQVFMEEDQAGPDPREISVALVGPDSEPTHDEFMANVYSKVQKSLKFLADEHVILEDPLSSTGTLSSMKNLEDAYTIGDQFLNDKSTEDEPRKLNMEAEVVFMVTVLIYQASSSVPPLSTPAIDLSPPKHVSSTTQKSKNLNNTTQNLRSRVFTVELRDLPHKINQTVNEVVKEAVHMFESGSYKSLPEHVALYEALEASMERARGMNSDLSKKKRHDSNASGSSQPPAPQSSAWKTTDTREAPSSSSKQQSCPHSEQPVENIPMPDTTNISDSEDTDSAHLLKIKSMPEWLKPIPEEDRPTTPEPD
ncbi:hypothetical protein Tco_0390485 [Tanacetum coccineum]